MQVVTVSPKYQVVIPLAARTVLGIRPGQRLQVLVYQRQLRLVPVRPLRELRGSLPGIGADVDRDEDRV
ncbi:MAG TPA: AbrB/MazE/SpoVT family DNA-binding domain-containing protein [Gemmatimonadaceae bacterium]